MRRYLVLVVLLLMAKLDGLYAQSTFNAPDTVCVRQPVTLTPNDTTAHSYYWSFCSGFMYNRPTGNLLGSGFDIDGANDIEIWKNIDGNYYGFFINTVNPEFMRMDFGNSLSNIPTIVSLGDLGGTVTKHANSLFITKDDKNNFVMFVVGGTDKTNSSLSRLDFGTSLANKPNCVNMGNYSNELNAPHGIFVAKEGAYWFGFTINYLDDNIIRFDFGTNISNTPNVVNLGELEYNLEGVSDLAATKDDAGNWHIYATNKDVHNVTHIGFGSSLANTPVTTVLVPEPDSLLRPTSISITKECGKTYAFIACEGKNNIVKMEFTDLENGIFKELSWENVSGLIGNRGLSRFVRERDNIYAFGINSNNTLVNVSFTNCTNSSIRSSEEKYPTSFTYAEPGKHSVFLAMNEGTPNETIECHEIEVIPIPAITIVDDTTICQNDTATLWVIAMHTDTLRWLPDYNNTNIVTSEDAIFTKVYPDYTRAYHMIAEYPNGCIVDSAIIVNVNKVNADAGHDRVLADGGTTILGGPMSTEGSNLLYEWQPSNFLENPLEANPKCTPFYDITYTLKVTNQQGCTNTDTVTVNVECNDINLPNAFTPEDHSNNNDYFRIINNGNNIIQLNQFAVYDRWGKEVFTTTDVSAGWNGKFEGKDCPYGVYTWVADGFCASGKRISKSGNVTLIR
jgi:gliding motility-associated-like protein